MNILYEDVIGKDQYNANIGLIKDVLRTLAKRGVYLTTTRVQKLFYLFERRCILDIGKLCFGLKYRYDRYGMYSIALREIIKHLNPEKDNLKVVDTIFERGSGKKIVFVEGWEEKTLPGPVERAIAKTLSEYGFLKTETLIERAKRTSPFIYAKKGESLDWEKLAEERCDKEEKLSKFGLKRLETVMESKNHFKFETIDDVKAYLFS